MRLAIGIGDESGYEETELLKFVSHKDVGVLKADTVEKLTAYIKWATVTATIGATHGKTQGGASGVDNSTNVILRTPPTNEPQISSAGEVF